MRILFIGDIFGRPGRDVARRAIPALVEHASIDFVIANGENAAAGFGITGEIEALRAKTRIIVVDFHAEATSEKLAMGWHLDGRATAVFGTHTHVQTADERILPKGTAYLTDVGMTGPHDSIIGVTTEVAL